MCTTIQPHAQGRDAAWQVFSTPGGLHHATYRPTPRGGWSVQVQCCLGEAASDGQEERVRGACEFMKSVGTELGGMFGFA